MARARDPLIQWDPKIDGFRAYDVTTPRRPTPAEQPVANRQTVGALLRHAFGLPVARGTAGLSVPAHLRKYVR